MGKYLFTSERLGFRNWLENDIEPFAEMCSNERVMEFFPKTLSYKETEKAIEWFQKQFQDYRHTYYAVEVLETQEFIGFIGLAYQTYESPFTPNTDIGWRLKPSAWGNGYATEGAKKCLEIGFKELGKENIIATCPKANVKSESVMKKIGMKLKGSFNHPKLERDSWLQPIQCYEIKKDDWLINLK